MKTTSWKHGGLVEWTTEDNAYLSVVFSWNLQDAYQRAVWLRASGYRVQVGGPATLTNPNYFGDVAVVGNPIHDTVARHNPNATFTSRGCIRKCPFCLVPKIEGNLVELDDWPIRSIICDNNLLACSKAHFDDVIDKLKPLSDIDFNQGLDTRLLTNYHAKRLSELKLYVIRLAWDHSCYEQQFLSAFQKLTDAGIPAKLVRVYVLIGYDDTPEDALYRLETIHSLGAWPNPMRYQPLDAIRRNEYVSSNWSDAELKDFARYWSKLTWLGHIPFSEYRSGYRKVQEESGPGLRL